MTKQHLTGQEDLRCVVYLDLLGFSRQIKRDFGGARDMYVRLMSHLQSNAELTKQALGVHESDTNAWRLLIASDSIVISSKSVKQAITAATFMIWDILLVGRQVVRGGVGWGTHYESTDGRMMLLVSEPLRQAAETEGTIAQFARVVLSKDSQPELVSRFASFDENAIRAEKYGVRFGPMHLRAMLVQSPDNLWSINPFIPIPHPIQYHDTILQLIRANTSHADKYLWLADLCNYSVFRGYYGNRLEQYYRSTDSEWLETLAAAKRENADALAELIPTWEYSTKVHRFFDHRHSEWCRFDRSFAENVARYVD